MAVEAQERKRLEHLCRTINWPALADQRVQLNAAGRVELKLKTTWRDGSTHLVMSPLEFLQRLAALVPRPRLHLIRFHGVSAPNAKLRSLVVPQGPPAHEEPASEAAAAAKCEVKAAEAPVQRISWPRLLKPVFDIDMQRCPNCSAGELKIIAAILDQWGECSNPFARPRDSLKAFKERFLKAFSIGNGRCADRD